MLGAFMDLCVICQRLILIADTQQKELKKLGCNPTALQNFERELNHLREMLHSAEK